MDIIEIKDILERTQEFIQDATLDRCCQTSTSLYRPITRLSTAQDMAEQYQDEVEKLKRETQLRKDIDAMIKAINTISGMGGEQ
jgi:membrane protein required for beta-lactamase induction